MRFSLQSVRNPDGSFCATCPELGVTANGRDQAEAADRVTSLIVEWLSQRSQPEFDREGFTLRKGASCNVYPLLVDGRIRLLTLPGHPSIN